MKIQNGFKNLLRSEDPLEWSLQEEQPDAEEAEPIKLSGKEIYADIKRARKDRKRAVRREQLEKRITSGWDKDKDVPTISNAQPSSYTAISGTGRVVSKRRKRKDKKARDLKKHARRFSSRGSPISSSESVAKSEENMLHLPDLQNKEKLQRAIVKAGTHDELYGDEEDDMESEMSGRIDKLKV
jgi:hypothetical protein